MVAARPRPLMPFVTARRRRRARHGPWSRGFPNPTRRGFSRASADERRCVGSPGVESRSSAGRVGYDVGASFLVTRKDCRQHLKATWLGSPRGKDSIRARGGIVLVGNLDVDLEQAQRFGHLLSPLPPEMRDDTAFMDRLHAYAPGWDYPKLDPRKHLTDHFGLVSDFLSECWTRLRDVSRASVLDGRIHFGGALSGSDIEAVRKTVSGVVKLLHPDPAAPVHRARKSRVDRWARLGKAPAGEGRAEAGVQERVQEHAVHLHAGAHGVEQFVVTPGASSPRSEYDAEPAAATGQVWAVCPGGGLETGPVSALPHRVTAQPGVGRAHPQPADAAGLPRERSKVGRAEPLPPTPAPPPRRRPRPRGPRPRVHRAAAGDGRGQDRRALLLCASPRSWRSAAPCSANKHPRSTYVGWARPRARRLARAFTERDPHRRARASGEAEREKAAPAGRRPAARSTTCLDDVWKSNEDLDRVLPRGDGRGVSRSWKIVGGTSK